MIKYKNKIYSDFIDLLQAQIESGTVEERLFPYPEHFYIKIHLEEKFNRKFSHKEIKEYIKELESANANTNQIEINKDNSVVSC